MAELRPSDVNRRRRRWSFAGCVFDEANWTLSVDGKRVAIETKPLEVLRELLLRAGNVVSKNELLDAIWPDVTVVEASLPTAVGKLRRALGDDRRDRSMIETAPGIGYRFAIPVELEDQDVATTLPSQPVPGRDLTAGAAPDSARPLATKFPGLIAVLGAVAILSAAVAFVRYGPERASAPKADRSFTQKDAEKALRNLDVAAIDDMLAAGWSPNTYFDVQGDDALGMLMNVCEWDPGHDQRRMLLLARTLLDGGAQLDHRNIWGDTAYSIAKARRFCGSNHPVTKMLRAMCYNGGAPLGDRCLATYELKRRDARK